MKNGGPNNITLKPHRKVTKLKSKLILAYLCVNHKTEFNTESEPSNRIELSDNA